MDVVAPPPMDEPGDAGEYCRAVERHLCQRNQGHLVRIVGPSFELVCGWAEQGIPLRVACRGIDRCVDRQVQKGPRRRPIRIEHCEADVLDVFDEWRRAIGAPRRMEQVDGAESGPRVGSLASHLERVVARFSALEGRSGLVPAPVAAKAGEVAREVHAATAHARTARGETRAQLLERLRQLDAELVDEARRQVPADVRAELMRQAEQELAPFRGRMTPEAYAGSVAALVDRLLRERYLLPVVAFE